MRLHLDKEAFSFLLSDSSQRSMIRRDIIEKDYYLTLPLWELAEKQDIVPAYFKGGTALYKAIGRMKRFSEDIDLTVEIQDCTKSQGKKRLEAAANGYLGLCRTKDKERESNQRGSITSVYEYTPVSVIDQGDALQRFGYVKVEATSFTVSEPTEQLEISPLLYSEATADQRETLRSKYDVMPFSIRTIKMERIFADKLLAAEFYYQRRMLFDTAKHLYDLVTMTEQIRIQRLLSAPEELVEMLAYKRREERVRIGSDLADKPFSEFCLFSHFREDAELLKAFMKMQRVYVFSEEDILEPGTMFHCLEGLKAILFELKEGLESTYPTAAMEQIIM